MPKLLGKTGSCWITNTARPNYPPLSSTIDVEMVVVGAGIVGLTTALRLCEAGRSVAVLEGLQVGTQVTGRSTAKITTQHALIYRHLIDSRGLELARRYADANLAGVEQIGTWIKAHDIACGFEHRAAYAYADNPERRDEIEVEADAARKVGLTAEVLDRAPLPFETGPTLCFPDQAQFNPANYLTGLARVVDRQGGRVFEHSRARFIGEASRWRVVTDHGTIHTENIVVATNITVKSPIGMATRTQPRSHVAMAFRIDDADLIDGMFIGIDDPTHSLRIGRDADGPLLVVLGPKYNTGHDGNVAQRFIDLERWVRSNLPVGGVAWHWCNEDYDTADRVAFVGAPDPEKAPGFYIATGFNAWGISNGTAAGILIADRIDGKANPWEELYDPTRPSPKDFHRDGDSQSIVASVEAIAPGEGGVIVRGEEKIAVWRNDAGEVHALSASCTHKGCTVTWNNAERGWDCPCHGSMFKPDGSVIHGPARKPLAPVEL